MENLFFIFRILLVGIFGVAGIAKLYDLSGSKKAVEGFGVPESLARPLGVLLPVFEILIAVSLIFTQTSWFGALGAAALLGVFIAGMTYQWSKGNAPDCHCFGQVHSEPVSPKSILRNVIFLIPAVALLLSGRNNQGLNLFDSNLNNSTENTPMEIIIGLATVGLLAAVVYFLKTISEQQTQIMRRIEILEFAAHDGTKEVEREDAQAPHTGLPIGSIAPEFSLPDLNGKTFSLKNSLKPKKSTVLLFVSPTCNPCGALLPEIEAWQEEFKEKANFVFVSSGAAKDNAEKLGGATFKQVLLQKDREVAELFGAQWTPSAVFVNAEGRIASHVAAGDSAIRNLFDKFREEADVDSFFFANGDSGTNKLGQPFPEFEVADIEGKTLTAKDLAGKPTLVAYWNVGCGWCQKMLDDLRDWDKTKGQDEPNLLVVSSGDAEKNKEMELISPILLDDKGVISKELGMTGTPSAVLVNANGKVISEIAVGADNIWKLVGRKIEKANEN